MEERILLVEDERKVAQSVKIGLEQKGYCVVTAESGESAEAFLHGQAFDAVILDLMLPGKNGLEVLAVMRQSDVQTPVLILTALDAVSKRVQGLDTGADDYLTKPFALPELLARVRALLRRGKGSELLSLTLADLTMDLIKHRVTRDGQPIELTVKEYEVLEYLLRHKEQVVSREMLAREVWNMPELYPALCNVMDVHVARLRRKIDDPFPTKLIHTVRGVGFVIREDS
ncbi:MAG: response regulator transcription factor [Armatimonadota bacterium]